MMIQHVVRRDVTMYYELSVAVVFTFMDVLGRGDRQQADSQGQRTRDDSRHPHNLNRMRRRAVPATRTSYAARGTIFNPLR